jgi:hypothetical protein
MKWSRETKRGFGKASVSLLAIALITFGPMATARAENEMDALMGGSAEKVSNAELAQQRGGFVVKGMMFHIAVEKRKSINGELEYASRLVADHNGWRETIQHGPRRAAEAAANAAQAAALTGPASTANGAGTPLRSPPANASSQTSGAPVATVDPSQVSTGAGLIADGVQGATQGDPNAPAEILGGVELVVDAVIPTGGPDNVSGNPAQVAGPPASPTAPSNAETSVPDTSLANVQGTGQPSAPTVPSVGNSNGMTSGGNGIQDSPATAGASVAPESPGPGQVQFVSGNQPLTNETVRRLLFGPAVVINDKNNIVIQEWTSITVDITNFSSIHHDALRSQLASSIADLIRAQTLSSLSGF